MPPSVQEQVAALATEAGQRLTALETDMGHVWRQLELSTQVADKAAKEAGEIRDLLHTLVWLGSAALTYLVGTPSAVTAAIVLRDGFKLLFGGP